MEKQKNYILSNWKKYNITDNQEDFLKLLNILEAHDENLDSFHDVSFNGYTTFCGITGEYESDRDTFNTLLQYNEFYPDEKSINEVLIELAKEREISLDEIKIDEDIRKTSDGYVRVLYY